ncbi:paraspeckle component 1-like isoform X1 [Panonychus citri]|uniref:paraspeckle component 1-like isoform X1 n=1 Tax=Panonychus citri TaxID=50023 RepID=UPI002306F3BA|nr:paraspeckle component 1-like isoform X1 [Panonychus citri]
MMSTPNENRGPRGKSGGIHKSGQNNVHAPVSGVQLNGAPTYEIDVQKKSKEPKKFTGRCRVFVANLPGNITEETLKKLFEKYGQVAEVFLGKGNSFAFVKMDTRANAEAARDALDLKDYEGRQLRVRLAAHAAAVRVKNLSPMVTNELLEFAFSYFGEVERAVVISDDRGRSTGDGIVEFARKSSAQNALKKCSQECFLLTAIPTPVDVEPFDQKDEEDGFQERHVNRNAPDFQTEREVGPRFAQPGTFEYEFAMRWKHLFDIEKQKRERLEAEIREDRQLLQEQMEYSRVEHQTNMLREQLRAMEDRANQFSQSRTNRIEDDRRREEERHHKEMMMRQQTDDLLQHHRKQDFHHLRHQENELRSKANQLQDLLDRQEQSLRSVQGLGNGPEPGPPPPLFPNRLNERGPAMGNQGHPPMGHPAPFQNNLGFDPEMTGPGGLGGPLGPHGPMGPMGGDPGPYGVPGRFDRNKPNQGPNNKRRRF